MGAYTNDHNNQTYMTGGMRTNNQAIKPKLFAHKIFNIHAQNKMNIPLIKYMPVQFVKSQLSPTQ